MISRGNHTRCSGRLRIEPGGVPASHDRGGLGEFGERLAAAHLAADGMVLLARNWRCRDGELDLVASLVPPDAMVFCEVKTRRTGRFGPPAAAIVPAKVARIRRLAARWMAETGTHGAEVRFDIVSVLISPTDLIHLEHLHGAF